MKIETTEPDSEAGLPDVRQEAFDHSSAALVDCFFGRARDQQGRAFREYCIRLADEFVNSDRISHTTRFADVRQRRADFAIPDVSLSASLRAAGGIPRNTGFHQCVLYPFIGHITSALPYFMRDLANVVVAMNQNTVKLGIQGPECFGARDSRKIPQAGLWHAGRVLRGAYPGTHTTLGVVTSGGTIANTTALWCARNTGLPATMVSPALKRKASMRRCSTTATKASRSSGLK